MAKRTASKVEPAETAPEGGMTTAIHLPREMWVLLRTVAFKRSLTTGGRASVSALIVELIERHRRELEREAAG